MYTYELVLHTCHIAGKKSFYIFPSLSATWQMKSWLVLIFLTYVYLGKNLPWLDVHTSVVLEISHSFSSSCNMFHLFMQFAVCCTVRLIFSRLCFQSWL